MKKFFLIGAIFFNCELLWAQVTPDISGQDKISESSSFFNRDCMRQIHNAPFATYTFINLKNIDFHCEKPSIFVSNYLKTHHFESSGSSFVFSEIEFGSLYTNAESSRAIQVDAREHSFLQIGASEGYWLDSGLYSWIKPKIAGALNSWMAFEISPKVVLSKDEVDIHTAYLKFGKNDFETTIGRFNERWGYGYTGSLILGGNQAPLTGIRVKNIVPVDLGGKLSFLGPFQFSLILARLSDDQFYPNSNFFAHKINFRPKSWLNVGFTQSVIFGGDGAPELTFGEQILDTVGLRIRNHDTENFSNRNAMFDIKITMNQFDLYSELFFEDCCSTTFARDTSNLAGLNFFANEHNRIGFEFLRTTRITYKNSIFKSGYADRQHFLGHVIGPNALGYYLFSNHKLTAYMYMNTIAAYEKRSRSEGILSDNKNIYDIFPEFEGPEQKLWLKIEPYWLYKNTQFRLEVGGLWVDNPDYVEKNNKEWAFLTSVRWVKNF